MIESLENQKVKYLSKLNTAKYRKKEKRFLIEGKHLVDEARKLGLLEEAFSLDYKDGYTQVSKAVMQKISNTDTVVTEIGLCKMIEKSDLSDHILILDAIQDPGNMGALMRSACAFGYKTIILGNGCVDIYNDKVIRSSQGAIFKINFINANLNEFIPTLKDYKIYGTDVINGEELDNVKNSFKLGIVLGNEGNGISPEVKEIIKENIYIPMDNTESLNVGVAGGIIMYKLRG
ncbi:MAG: RNA methyltransferase [Erysipelotrichaceae bacterium]|nr:RNA methyltransferase [Erysipelotrichaceae bacterium]